MQGDGVANHPNQWYQASVKYYAIKSGTLAPGTAGTGNQDQGGGGQTHGGGGGEGVSEESTGLSSQQHDSYGEPPTD